MKHRPPARRIGWHAGRRKPRPPRKTLREGITIAIFTNRASLSYAGRLAHSNLVTGSLTGTGTAAKTPVSADYVPGGTLTYAVSLVNDGGEALTDLTITDDLGGYSFDGGTVYPLAYITGSARLFVDGVLQSAPTVTAGPPLVFSGVTVPAGGSAVLIYEAEVTDWAPLGTGAAITNTAVITGQNTDLTVNATVPAAAAPQLGITKAVSPADVAPGGSLTYTFTLTNTGTQADAAQEIVVSDVFDPVLSGLAVTLDGAPLSAAADYTYDEATGAFATVPGAVTVPAAAYAQQSDGSWAVTPGAAVLCVSGTV